MKIVIASYGRSHMLDTARELAALGHDVQFYSLCPSKRCEQFGLAKKYVKGFFFIPGVVEYLCRRFHWSRKARNKNEKIMDFLVALQLRKCDVFIAMSGCYVRSLKVAKRKYNAKVIVERGCKHILEQDSILRNIAGARVPTKEDIRKELRGYELADYVMSPSDHARQSFIKHGYPEHKILLNPYGTSLKEFCPTPKPTINVYDVIMVGNWDYQKGCDILTEACKRLQIRLLHVGAVGDCPLPEQSAFFTQVNPVEQSQLINYYRQARIAVLSSRQEGLALVQAQAIACGLPLVCSKDTGGRDLAAFLPDKRWVIEMEETTVDCLMSCINRALSLAASQPEGDRNYAGNALEQLSWGDYGKRYDRLLKTIFNERNSNI